MWVGGVVGVFTCLCFLLCFSLSPLTTTICSCIVVSLFFSLTCRTLFYFTDTHRPLFFTHRSVPVSNVVGPTRGLAASRGDGGVSSAFLVYEYDVMGRPQLLTNQPTNRI